MNSDWRKASAVEKIGSVLLMSVLTIAGIIGVFLACALMGAIFTAPLIPLLLFIRWLWG